MNGTVQYDDTIHRYYVGSQTYTSATQLVENFKNKFETERMAEWMEHRYGNTKEYWIAKWKKDNSDSLDRGNSIHEREEKKLLLKGYDLQPFPVPVQESQEDVDYYQLPDGVYPELKLWRHDCALAGRADKVYLYTVPTGMTPTRLQNGFRYEVTRYMTLDDHKTNKIIRTESFQNWETKKFAMMLGPLSHLMDCEMVHYSLQLSIYQYMGEYHGFQPGRRRIIHHRHPVPGISSTGPKITELPYLRNEVIAMLKSII